MLKLETEKLIKSLLMIIFHFNYTQTMKVLLKMNDDIGCHSDEVGPWRGRSDGAGGALRLIPSSAFMWQAKIKRSAVHAIGIMYTPRLPRWVPLCIIICINKK